jgi:hypothetical protein
MNRVLQQTLRLATLLIGVSVTSVALAVATVEATYTGPQAKIGETTVQLFDSNGAEVKPDPDNRNRFIVLPGIPYTVQVSVGGKPIGPRTSITPVEGNNQLRADSETGVAQLVPPPALAVVPAAPFSFMSGVQPGGFSIFAGAGLVKDKAPTIGVNLVTDEPLLRGASTIYTANLDGSFNLIKDGRPGCRWDFGGSWGDRSTSGEIPSGTSAGYAFWLPEPVSSTTGTSGSTGVSSSGGWDTHLKSKFSEFHLAGALPYPIWEPAPWSIGGEPSIGYRHSEFKYGGSIVSQALPGLSSTTDQKIREDDFRIGYALWKRYVFSNRIWAEGVLGLDAIHYHGRYNGTQNNLCSFCRTPLLTEFDVSTSDSKSGGTWGMRVGEKVAFPIGQSAELRLSAMYRYDNKSPVLVNNVTPSDPAPHLETHSRQFWTVGVDFALPLKY